MRQQVNVMNVHVALTAVTDRDGTLQLTRWGNVYVLESNTLRHQRSADAVSAGISWNRLRHSAGIQSDAALVLVNEGLRISSENSPKQHRRTIDLRWR